MTLFKRTEGTLDELDKALSALEADSASGTADVVERKRRLDEMTVMADTLSQNCTKLRKAAQESDPSKRTYGEQMCKKVIELCDRFDALAPKIESVSEQVSAAYGSFEKAQAAQAEAVAAAQTQSVSAALLASAEDAASASTSTTAAAGASAAAAEPTTVPKPEPTAAPTVSPAAVKPVSTPATSSTAAATAPPPQAASASSQLAPATKQSEPASPAAAPEPAEAAVTLNLKSNVAGEGSTAITVANLDMTVLELKQAVQAQMGHAPEAQRIIFTGRVLDNDKPLRTYSISNKCTLHLIVSKSLLKTSPAASPAKEDAGTGAQAAAGPPAGKVFALQGGAIELRQVLANAGSKLVVVDWMAPWCGPCRAIGPKIEELAANHADAIFVKIDTEATGENKALAMDAQIRAFPTFHFYLKTAKVTEIVGADVGKISAAVAAHKPSVVTSADAALGSADPAAADALVAKVKSALVTLKAGCSSDQEFIGASKTLLSFIGNCVNNPSEAKYRRIRKGNPSFQSRLGSKPGGIATLEAFGFRQVEEGLPAEEYLVLDEVRPEMLTVKKLLEQAVPGGSAASAAPASSLNSSSSPGGTGMGALPGLGGMAGGGVMNPFGGGGAGGMGGMPDMERAMRMMENPAIRRITQGVMSNPRMMQVMQESMQSGNPMAMMQDPEFQQTMQGIMSDPEMLAAMQNPDTMAMMMQGMGGMGGMGGGMGGSMAGGGGLGGLGGLAGLMGGMGGRGMGGFGAGGPGGGAGMPATTPTTPSSNTPATPAPVTGGGGVGGEGGGENDDEEEAMLAEALRLSLEAERRDQQGGEGGGT